MNKTTIGPKPHNTTAYHTRPQHTTPLCMNKTTIGSSLILVQNTATGLSDGQHLASPAAVKVFVLNDKLQNLFKFQNLFVQNKTVFLRIPNVFANITTCIC